MRISSRSRHALVVALYVALASFGATRTASAEASGAEASEGGRGRELELDFDLDASEGAGAMVGYRTRPVRALLVAGRLHFVPELTYGILRVQLDADIHHRLTLFARDGNGVPEVRGDGAVDVRLRPTGKFRLHLGADIKGVGRPNWLDQYQPEADGSLLPTDRYSHWSRGFYGRIGAIPMRHQHLRAGYRYSLVEYLHDPNFDPYNRPTHLVPRSHEQHEAEFAWHYVHRGLHLGGAVEAFHRSYFYAFSRDAGTGQTHAAPGGSAPNPLQRFVGIEPSVDAEFELGPDERITLDLEYAHEVVLDPFEGYYSTHAPKPSVRIELAATEGLDLALDASFRHRIYFDGGYQQSANHPPLDQGDRRFDTRFTAGFRLEQRIVPHLKFFTTLDWTLRKTNFPDYEPGVFPSTQSYDVDWDYFNFAALAGLRYRR